MIICRTHHKNKLVGCDGYMRVGGAYIMGKMGKYICI